MHDQSCDALQPSTTNNQQPTTNNQQPTTNNQQPTTNNQVSLFIHRSNRLDTLLTILSDIVVVPLSDPYVKETIVVSSLGLERWLVSELSRRFGVWTNAEHPLPRAFVERVLEALVPLPASFDAWERGHLALSVARILSDAPCVRQWPTLDGYLEGESRRERTHELSYRIADMFDQYLVYRPDWVDAWQRGNPVDARVEPWQPSLFVELVARLGPHHFANRLQQALDRLEADEGSLAGLPERVCCFQGGLMPPSYLRLLHALGRRIDTHLFVLSPSRAYVEFARDNRSQTGPSESSERVARERWQGQPLFASLCRQSRQLDAVLALLPDSRPGRERYFESEPRNLLELLQTDICALRERRVGGMLAPFKLTADDRSIEVHACHSRRREIECLRESLLDQFEDDPSLAPEDVLVMLADIQDYAPLVDAVFGSRKAGAGQIPYTIADRSPLSFNALADSLLHILELFSQRLTPNRLLELLTLGPIQQKFQIAAPGRIERWLRRLQFTWGIDTADRQAAGAPPAEEHTLRFCLSRLLLGVALDSKTAPVFAGRAPFDLEGDDADLAGRLAEACESVFEFKTRLLQDQSIDSYAALVRRLIDELCFDDRETLWQRTEICDRLNEFSRVARESGFDEKITFHTLRHELEARLGATNSARAFLGGGVTFCKMLPLRSIPFRVIAMVGLQDGQFPRRDRRSHFDALSQNLRTGDRRTSDEDRFLFAETLLACRERLIITYVGRSARDDSALPPSVVVEELLGAIDESCEVQGHRGLCPRDLICRIEALQPFSPRYFDGSQPRLVNRSTAHFRAAQVLRSARLSPIVPNYSCLELPQPSSLELRDLVSLLRHPGRLYLEKALLVADDPRWELNDGLEPVALDALCEWRLTREWIAAHRRNESEPVFVDRLRARGELPILALGELAFDTLRDRTKALLNVAELYGQGEPLEEKWVSITIDGIRVEGWIDSLWPGAHVHMRRSRMAVAGLVEAWVEHLCASAAGLGIMTVMIARSNDRRSVVSHGFEPLEPDHAKQLLGQLLQDYRLALAVPLPFWLEPGDGYFRAKEKVIDHSIALLRASESLEQLRADGRLDSHFEALYGDNPCADEWPAHVGVPQVLPFARWAERWLGPLYRVLKSADDHDEPETGEVVG